MLIGNYALLRIYQNIVLSLTITELVSSKTVLFLLLYFLIPDKVSKSIVIVEWHEMCEFRFFLWGISAHQLVHDHHRSIARAPFEICLGKIGGVRKRVFVTFINITKNFLNVQIFIDFCIICLQFNWLSIHWSYK